MEEYVLGKTLREIIDEGNIQPQKIKTYMLMICEALNTLHNNQPQLIHRDIKPENIVVTDAGDAKLIDFGIVREYKRDNEHDTVMMGTRGYAAPEQYGYTQTDVRSDIYSMGIVLKELYEACENKNASKGKIQRIIKKATMFDPDKRYGSIDEMRKDITKLYVKNKILIGAAAVAAAAVLAVGVFYLRQSISNVVENETESTSQINLVEVEKQQSYWFDQGIWYNLEGDHFEFWGILDGAVCPEKIVIPSELGGIPVTVIGSNALLGQTNAKEVHIPSSVTTIYMNSFAMCDLVIYGEKGSYAEEFCKKYGYEFIEENN